MITWHPIFSNGRVQSVLGKDRDALPMKETLLKNRQFLVRKNPFISSLLATIYSTPLGRVSHLPEVSVNKNMLKNWELFLLFRSPEMKSPGGHIILKSSRPLEVQAHLTLLYFTEIAFSSTWDQALHWQKEYDSRKAQVMVTIFSNKVFNFLKLFLLLFKYSFLPFPPLLPSI